MADRPGSTAVAHDLGAAAPQRPWLVLVLVCAAQFMCVLDDTIVNVALPSIQRGLGFDDASLSWVLNGYLVTFGGLLLLGGRVADLIVRRTVFLGGLVVFGVASLVCGLAGAPVALMLARVVQGAGAAFMSAAALAILTSTFPGAGRHRAFGVWGGLSGVAGALGMLLGGALTTALSWRAVFLINVPVVLVVAVASLRWVPARRAAVRATPDFLGAVTVTLGSGLLVVAIVRTGQVGWASITTVVSLAGAALLLAAFVAVQARRRAPLLPLGVLTRRNVAGGLICGVLLAGAMLGTFLFLTLYLQRVLGYTAVESGLAYVPMSLTVVVTATLASTMITRLGFRPVLATGFALLAAAMLWFTRIDVGGGYLADVLGPALLGGAGLGTTLVAVVTTATHDLRGDGEAGLASGLVSATQQIGGALGIAVLSAVAYARVDADLPVVGGPVALTIGFRLAFGVAALLAAAGVVVALVVTRDDR